MHYKNGREAKVGDLVRGKGYNFKHEIIGILIAANPQSDTCNCTVATVGISKVFAARMIQDSAFDADGKVIPLGVPPQMVASNESGQLDAFEALDPETGEVLPGPEATV